MTDPKNPFPNNALCERPKKSLMRKYCQCQGCLKWRAIMFTRVNDNKENRRCKK